MRRLLVLSVAALAVGGATISSAAGREHARPMIVCPVTPTPPCCGPPLDAPNAIPTCCPGPIVPVCQPALSIAASPDPMTAGAKVTISGLLTHTSGSGATVQLWQKVAGATGFSKDGTATTNGAGTWSMTIPAGTVMTNRSWYATANGLTSPTVSEPVSAVITLHAGTVRLHGSVTPAHAHARVLLQQLQGNKWVTIARARLSRRSAYSFARGRLHGTLRVLLAANKENALSASNKLLLS